jgi:hypothetical protein
MTAQQPRIRVRVIEADFRTVYGCFVLLDGRHFTLTDSHRKQKAARREGSAYVRYSDRPHSNLVPMSLLFDEIAYRVRIVVTRDGRKTTRFLRHGLVETEKGSRAGRWDLKTATGIANRAAKDLVIGDSCTAELFVEPARRD